MIFNLGGGSSKGILVLDNAYPADVSADVGESASFKVVIKTHGTPAVYAYQWYLDGKAVSGATADSYKLDTIRSGGHTVYCVVTHEAGSVMSRVATVTAQGAYLFSAGDECTAFSGGWVVEACRPPDTSHSYAPTKTVSGDTMEAKMEVSSYGRSGVVRTANAIDLSSYSKICFHVTDLYNPEDKNRLGVMASYGGETFEYLAYAVAAKGVVTVDVSEITGSFAVCIAIVCNRYEVYGSSSVTVDAVWLE